MFSLNHLFIGWLIESVYFILVSSNLSVILMIIYFAEGLRRLVSSSCLNYLLSYWGIMICTFSLNVSLYKWLFYRVTKASSCLGTDSLLNFILRFSNYIIYSKSNRLYFIFPVKISPHLIICMNKFLKFFL